MFPVLLKHCYRCRRGLVLLLLTLQSAAPLARPDVVINEIVAGASDRRVQWDANGVPHLGSGTPWQATSFNDSTWSSGPGPFGFGTYTGGSLSYGTNLTTQMLYITPTVYLRKAFGVSNAQTSTHVQLIIKYNDGFICSINGTEVVRRWAGPPYQFQYHDQPAYNPDLSNTKNNPTTLYSETIDLGPASSVLQNGTNVIAIHGLNWSTTSPNFGISATLQLADGSITFVNPTDVWKYLVGVVEPSGGNYDPTQLSSGHLNVPWGTGDFDDSNWQSGPGPLCIGPNCTSGTTVSGVIGTTPSVYMRYVFNWTPGQASDTQQMQLVVDYDDAFVAYVNGVEVARANIASPNVFTPHTAVANGTHNYGTAVTYTIDTPAKLLVSGDNVLAVQVHNVSVSDPDLYLKSDLKTSTGTFLVKNTNTATFFAGTDEPVQAGAPNGEEEASSPPGPSYDSDWVELYNTGNSTVDLSGWSLTDTASTPAKWMFPAGTSIPSNGYLVIFCDGLNITSNPGGNLHTNFSLSSGGEYLGLYDQTGTLVQNFSPTFPPASKFYSYGRDVTGNYVYFDTITPGSPNTGNEFTGIVTDPTLSIAGGFYSSAQTVTISCTTPNSNILYTTDGSEPTVTNGTPYGSGIAVSANTAIRVRAFANGLIPSNTVTNTYLINESAVHKSLPALCITGDQQRSLYRPYGLMAIMNNASANYPGTSPARWEALPANPNIPQTFDPTQYNNPQVGSDPGARPVSAELFYSGPPPAGSSNFRTDVALRPAGSTYCRPRYVLTAQNSGNDNGAWIIDPAEKPSFNFYFKGDYGISQLDQPLFPNSSITQFDDLRLRSGHNDLNPFILDEFMRRCFVSTGAVGSVGLLNTLYVNGVYKGYYNITEHLRQHFFQEAYHSTNDWDVRQVDVIPDGDGLAFQDMIAYVRNNDQSVLANYQGMQTRLDMTNFCDYLIINLIGATGDWPLNNYVVARERVAGALHRFYMWDAEVSFGKGGKTVTWNNFTGNDSGLYTPLVTSSPGTDAISHAIPILYTLLQPSPEFRLRFADRIQRNMFNNGPLVEANMLAQYNPLKAQIKPFVTGFIDPVTSWLNGTPSRRQVLFGYTDSNNVFHQGILVGQGLWPATTAPVLSQYGGAVSAGYQLTITNPNNVGSIYYTLDGTDPRVPGGAVSSTARPYSAAITLNQTTEVKTRVLNTTGEWSPIIDVIFTIAQPPSLQLTEIMYHPPSQGTTDESHYEFLEFKNTGTSTVNMSGMTVTGGVSYTFPSGTYLAAGAFAVLVSDPTAFASKYPSVTPTGVYSGNLDNSSATINLNDFTGTNILSCTYHDSSPWPKLADGYGNSLVPVNPNSNPDPNNPANWRASSALGGSPGADDPAPTTPAIVVNELLANSVSPQTDEVELYNPTNQAADISGWFLSDDSNNPKKFQIPAGMIMAPNSYLVYTEADFNPTPGQGTSFSFDKNGEEVRLSAADSSGNPTGYSHGFTFGPSNPGVSFGRYINSVGVESFPAQQAQTFGAPNSGPLVGPVVITEMMYHPASGGDEFLELRNISNNTVPLYDPLNPNNTWQITNLGSYTFPTGISLAPGQIILVTPLSASAWRAKYGTPSAIAVYGPYTGKQSNSGERRTLQMPGTPYLNTNNQTVVPYIDVDAVSYLPTAPWPTSANGSGPSLERINQYAYADDPANWRASSVNGGTPGTLPPISFSTWESYRFSAAQLADPTISGASADPDGDGRSNLLEFFFDSNPLTSNSGSGLTSYMAMDGGNGPYLTIQFRHNLAATNTTYFGDTSADLVNWTLGAGVQVGTPTNNGDGTETVTLRDTVPVSGANKRFIRLRVNSN